eukprot:m.64722 g.64722  ORF g.64722 m.64722 type:complete len:92 (-) comp8123_c0_seq3:413-688(-)
MVAFSIILFLLFGVPLHCFHHACSTTKIRGALQHAVATIPPTLFKVKDYCFDFEYKSNDIQSHAILRTCVWQSIVMHANIFHVDRGFIFLE